MNRSATSILRCGAESTACGYFAPPYSIVVISSRGAAFSIALTNISTGFFLVLVSIISNAFLTMVIAVSAFPPHLPELMKCFFALCPGTMSLLMSLSTMVYFVFQNRTRVFLPAIRGTCMGRRLT